MHSFFHEQRVLIETELKNFFAGKKGSISYTGTWGADLMDRFYSFCIQGKMIRGGLIILGYSLFRDDIPDIAAKTAAAIEIIHSSLLIHDDIMDRDDLRRGKKTFHVQYRDEWMKRQAPDPDHFGKSLAICAGDIGFFLTFDLLSELNVDPLLRAKILAFWSKELTTVGLAQMQDVSHSLFPNRVTQRDILEMYRYKTARYTFSLPLATGALLAGQTEDVTGRLIRLGEQVGIIFQIKDDEIEFFGDSDSIGKSAGSDIREGKKTLFHLHLQKMLDAASSHSAEIQPIGSISDDERRFLERIIGRIQITAADLSKLRQLVERYGIREKIQHTINELQKNAEKEISKLPVGEAKKRILMDILESSISRTY